MENKWTLVPNNTNLTLPNKNGSSTNLVWYVVLLGKSSINLESNSIIHLKIITIQSRFNHSILYMSKHAK